MMYRFSLFLMCLGGCASVQPSSITLYNYNKYSLKEVITVLPHSLHTPEGSEQAARFVREEEISNAQTYAMILKRYYPKEIGRSISQDFLFSLDAFKDHKKHLVNLNTSLLLLSVYKKNREEMYNYLTEDALQFKYDEVIRKDDKTIYSSCHALLTTVWHSLQLPLQTPQDCWTIPTFSEKHITITPQEKKVIEILRQESIDSFIKKCRSEDAQNTKKIFSLNIHLAEEIEKNAAHFSTLEGIGTLYEAMEYVLAWENFIVKEKGATALKNGNTSYLYYYVRKRKATRHSKKAVLELERSWRKNADHSVYSSKYFFLGSKEDEWHKVKHGILSLIIRAHRADSGCKFFLLPREILYYVLQCTNPWNNITNDELSKWLWHRYIAYYPRLDLY
jgi:hypothetical protein